MMTSPFIDNSDLPLVMIGGTLCNARLWHPLIERLNVSMVTSVALTQADSAPDAARALLKILPERFILVGFSLGAIVALQIAADAPQRLGGLALISVNPLADRPENAVGRRLAIAAARQQGHGRWLRETLWHRYVAPQQQENQALCNTLCLMAEESTSQTFARQTEIAISRRDNRAALAKLTCPLLILNGAHDGICTPEHHRLAATSARHAECITFPQAGHFVPLEAADEAACALRSWIMR